MSKDELVNNDKLIKKCYKFGLDVENAEIYDDVIIVSTPLEDVYVIFDKNFNTIGVADDIFKDKERFASDFYEDYCRFTDVVPFRNNFGYPFETYSLRDFINIGHSVDVIKIDDETITTITMNGETKKVDRTANEEYAELLTYIKFISEKTERYFPIFYYMQVMGFEMPDIYEYLRTLLQHIAINIGNQVNNNKTPLPQNIISIEKNDKDEVMINEIINLHLRQMDDETRTNLSDYAEELLRVFGLDENIKSKESEGERRYYNISEQGEKIKTLVLKNFD